MFKGRSTALSDLISQLYRHTLKNISVIDRSAVMEAVKRSYVFLSMELQWAKQRRVDRKHNQSHILDRDEEQAFSLLLKHLGLEVSPEELLSRLRLRMRSVEFDNLLALLHFMSYNRVGEAHPSASVIRAADIRSTSTVTTHRRNILFITGEFPNPRHGGGGRLIDFIKVISQDHDVYLYSWFDGSKNPTADCILDACCKKVEKVHSDEFEGNREKVKQFVGDTTFDIVHYEWPRSLTNYDPSLGTHQIFTYMEAVSFRLLMDMELIEPPLGARWLRTLISLLNALKVEIVDAAEVDARIVVTQKDGEFISRFDPNKEYIVLNHGINLDEFCLPDITPEDRTLVFAGNFRHYPNENAVFFFFEQIFGEIRAQIPDVNVYLVGTNPSRQVMRYHDGRHIYVTGAVEDIRPYIQRATVCIAPLITGAGLRSKVIQYAALKRVCVATSIAATDLLFEDGKDIFIADDPSTFAQHVIYLLQHPDVARRMAQSAFEKARLHYDNRNLILDLYRVYAKLDERG